MFHCKTKETTYAFFISKVAPHLLRIERQVAPKIQSDKFLLPLGKLAKNLMLCEENAQSIIKHGMICVCDKTVLCCKIT
jgi:hypothetical protein